MSLLRDMLAENEKLRAEVEALKEQLRQANKVRDVFAMGLVMAAEQDFALSREGK